MTRMRHTEPSVDPQIAAELEALEAALAGEPHADPALAALVRDVRGSAEPMPAALRERLDGRVAAGFPRAARARPSWWRMPAGRPMAVLAAAAVVLIAVVVATTALRSSSSPGTGGQAPVVASGPATDSSGAAGESAAPHAKAAPPAATGQALAPASPDSSSSSSSGASRGFARKVERAVELDLRVGATHLQRTVDGVVRVTQQAGGYVADSAVSGRPAGGDAQLTLRIPTSRLDATVAQLSRLGHVARLDQSSTDITGSFVSAADRLKDARAERRALLRALGRATTATEIASLKARIAANRSEIARRSGELDALRRRADLATVAVGVTARGSDQVAVPAGGGWSIGGAGHDALRVLEVVASAVIVAAAALIPLGLIAAAGLWVTRILRRRRREHALDPA